jgi:hypothetical protein
VPQHQLPPLGQRGERLGRGLVVEAGYGAVVERHARVVRRDVVGGLHPRGDAGAVDVQAPHRGQQVRAEGLVGAAAALQHLHHLRERVGDQVLGVAAAAGELQRQAAGGVLVAREELAVRLQVAGAHCVDEVGVGAIQDRPGRLGGAHTPINARVGRTARRNGRRNSSGDFCRTAS